MSQSFRFSVKPSAKHEDVLMVEVDSQTGVAVFGRALAAHELGPITDGKSPLMAVKPVLGADGRHVLVPAIPCPATLFVILFSELASARKRIDDLETTCADLRKRVEDLGARS